MFRQAARRSNKPRRNSSDFRRLSIASGFKRRLTRNSMHCRIRWAERQVKSGRGKARARGRAKDRDKVKVKVRGRDKARDRVRDRAKVRVLARVRDKVKDKAMVRARVKGINPDAAADAEGSRQDF